MKGGGKDGAMERGLGFVGISGPWMWCFNDSVGGYGDGFIGPSEYYYLMRCANIL